MHKKHIHHDALVDYFWRGAAGSQLDVTKLKGQMTIEDAEAMQLEILDRWCTRGESLGGWKVGLTSGASRDAFGKGVRPFGHILRNRIIESGDELKHSVIKHCGVENELCFIIERDLVGPNVTPRMARAAALRVAPAFEVNETRVAGDVDGPCRVADNLSHWGIVVGEFQRFDPDFDFESVSVALMRDGMEVERGDARGNIDDHFLSIAALARELAKFGRKLQAGQRVITGSLTRQSVKGASHWEADFGAFGTVSINFE